MHALEFRNFSANFRSRKNVNKIKISPKKSENMIFECSFYNCGQFINFFEQFLPRKKQKYCCLLVFKTQGSCC